MKIAAWLACLLLPVTALAQDDDSRTVLGPENADLYDGAMALMRGDVDEGIRLTQSGLSMAGSRRERVSGFANLCAGYILRDDLELALEYCDRALRLDERHWRALSNRALILVRMKRYDEAQRDLDEALALRPDSDKVLTVQAMLRDATDPVTPNVIIEDRRVDGVNDDTDG